MSWTKWTCSRCSKTFSLECHVWGTVGGKRWCASCSATEVERLRAIVSTDVLLEKLADQEHERWSRWMRWMFATWNQENTQRWRKQAITAYKDLPEHSKESDRKEARKTLAVFREAAETGET